MDILKKAGLIGANEKINAEFLAAELSNDPAAAEAIKELENSSGESGGGSETSSSSPEPQKQGGIVGFVKANPVPSVIGGGLLAYGIYKVMTPKKKKVDNLAGYRAKKAANRKKSAKSYSSKNQTKKLPTICK